MTEILTAKDVLERQAICRRLRVSARLEMKRQLLDIMKERIMSTIDKTLEQRGERYGDFEEHARITQNIKRAMQNSPNWCKLSDDKREALDMVAHKIGRILNGDPTFHDSWHDIVGYVRLVEKTLQPTLFDHAESLK